MTKIRIMNWNSRALRPQLIGLENFLSEKDVDVACITKIFLYPANKILVAGFSNYGHNRADGRAAILTSAESDDL